MFVNSELVGTSVDLHEYNNPAFFADLEPHMMSAARRAARTEARSYRDFLVGACGAVLFRGAQEVVFLASANNSPYRGAPKRCAEMGLIQQADGLAVARRDAAAILAMYVAGPNNPELIKDVTGLETSTLHSCADCQGLMQGHAATPEDMRLVTFGLEDDGTPPERHTLGGLLALYTNVAPPLVSSQLLADMTGFNGVSAGRTT